MNTPKTTRDLLFLNVGMFVITALMTGFNINSDFLALHNFSNPQFHYYQIITHMFMHGGIMHLLFNMIVLWSIGGAMEKTIKNTSYITLYFLCGLGAAILMTILFKDQRFLGVGASAAIFGIMASFFLFYPEDKLLLYFILPIKTKYLILIAVAYEFFNLIFLHNIASFAHIAGFFIGFIYTEINYKKVKYLRF